MPSLSTTEDGITRLTPVALPGVTRPGVRATTAPLLRAQIRWALRRLRIRPDVVVAGYLQDVLGRWDGAVSVLYSTDDHVAGAGLMGLSATRIMAQERQAVARADVLAVVSPALAEHWAALGADPVLIPNGSRPGYAADAAPAPAVIDLPRPLVGLIGQLTPRIDMGLLEAIADAGLSLLLVGPYDARWERERFAALTARPNVRYAGRVPAEEVPRYLAAIDVGLTPYADTPFNQASFPMKTLEYFSAGLPVVSTDLPGSQWLRDELVRHDPAAAGQLMALTSDGTEFVAAVRRLAGPPTAPAAGEPPAASEADQARAASARAFAAQHTWARRAEALAVAVGLLAPSREPDAAQVR
jgi:teichuronic acid biosynthesis glycosyltransferase TuaH